MTPRPRHPDKDLERVLRAGEHQGWRVEKRPRGYFKMYCPYADKHFKTVHITPNKAYLRDLLKWLKRETCWEEDA